MKIFITGASAGIGEALAREYSQRADTVLGLCARRLDKLKALSDALGATSAIYAADVRDAQAMRSAAHDFVSRYGAPDIVIANAGVSAGTVANAVDDIDVASWIMDVNVIGMVRTFQPFIDAMRSAGQGKLVGIASVAGIRGIPGSGAYSASKAAAIAYLESLRVELRGAGIRVQTICPGYITTDMTANNDFPMPFIITAEDAARRIARVIDSGRAYAVIPWQMAIVARILKFTPRWLFDRAFANSPRKARVQKTEDT